MNRSSKQSINKKTLALNHTVHQVDLTDSVYRTFHPKVKEYTFFSNAHGTLSRIDHRLSHNKVLINLRLKLWGASCSPQWYIRRKLEKSQIRGNQPYGFLNVNG